MVLQEFITGKLYLNWGFTEGFTKEIMTHKCETELLTHEELGLGQEGKGHFSHQHMARGTTSGLELN